MRSAARANLKVVDAVPVGASRRYHFHALGEPAEQPVELAEECALALAYNGISQAVMMVSPADLEDFVVGFSLGAGIVEHRGEIYDLRLSGTRSARQAEVEISSRAFWRLKQQRRGLPGTSSCGLCGVEALEQALPRLAPLPPSALPAPGYLNGLRQRIATFQPLAHDCGAVHCALFMDASGEIRLAREDIGRPSAQARGHDLDVERVLVLLAELHDRALAEIPLDLGQRRIQRLRFVHGNSFDHPRDGRGDTGPRDPFFGRTRPDAAAVAAIHPVAVELTWPTPRA